jgi:hypothetical protein
VATIVKIDYKKSFLLSNLSGVTAMHTMLHSSVKRRTIVLLATTALLLVGLGSASVSAQSADPNYLKHSKQNIRNGASSVWSQANYGRGTLLDGSPLMIANLDTGININSTFLKTYNGEIGSAGVDLARSRNCLTGSCLSTNVDDVRGHGSMTAGVMIGNLTSSTGIPLLAGVAPNATLFSVRVMSDTGSVANISSGIRYAVDAGAKILNLSLGPVGSPSAKSGFYTAIASAVNYATAKGAYLVFAGGNDSQLFADPSFIRGFTDQSLQRMILVGSTNDKQQLSSFSSTPGSGSIVSTSGKSWSASGNWIMAEGEWILVPLRRSGPDLAFVQGTSFAAPQISGALDLLLAKWPILARNGFATAVLQKSAKDLGAKGNDAVYGTGFLDLVQAFKPIGDLQVANVKGQLIPVSQVTTSLLTGGALGNLNSISAQLKNWNAWDFYERNFSVDLSGLLTKKAAPAPVTAVVTAPKTTVGGVKFDNGATLAFGNMEEPIESVTVKRFSATDNNTGSKNMFMSFTDRAGSTFAAGNGFPASASFAEALWGGGSTAAMQAGQLGTGSALTSLAEGGQFLAFGTKVPGNNRLAMSLTQTTAPDPLAGADLSTPDARALSLGLTHDVSKRWKLGMTLGMLDEQNGILGSTYSPTGPLSFGSSNHSTSITASSSVALADKLNLMVDATIARTTGSAAGSGLVSNVSDLYAQSYGVSLVQGDVVKADDSLSLSLKAPLRVYSGSAGLAVSDVGEDGLPATRVDRVSLAPSGRELNLTLGYQAPIDDSTSWNLSLQGRHDADNVAGSNDVAVVAGWKMSF